MKSSWRFARRPVYFDFGAGTVKHLLAATFTDSTVFFTPMGDEESRGSSFVGRYEGPGDDEKTSLGYRADEAFAHLDEEVLGCSILLKNSLHDNGYGSATALSRTKFMAQCGIAPLEFET